MPRKSLMFKERKMISRFIFLFLCLLFIVGCGGSPSSNSPPSQPKLTATTSANTDGTTTLTWNSNDSSITNVDVQKVNGDILYSGGSSGSSIINESVVLVAYAANSVVVVTLNITLPPIPPPPPIIMPPPTEDNVDFTVSWSLPTTYSDNTSIEQSALDNLVVEVYWNDTGNVFTVLDTRLGISSYGATSLNVYGFHVIYGKLYYFGVRCQVAPSGLWSDFSSSYEYVWVAP